MRGDWMLVRIPIDGKSRRLLGKKWLWRIARLTPSISGNKSSIENHSGRILSAYTYNCVDTRNRTSFSHRGAPPAVSHFIRCIISCFRALLGRPSARILISTALSFTSAMATAILAFLTVQLSRNLHNTRASDFYGQFTMKTVHAWK